MQCPICGGNAGISERMPVHNLCVARQEIGVETPPMVKCETCDGSGYTFPSDWSAMNPSQAVFDRFKCKACNGHGSNHAN